MAYYLLKDLAGNFGRRPFKFLFIGQLPRKGLQVVLKALADVELDFRRRRRWTETNGARAVMR